MIGFRFEDSSCLLEIDMRFHRKLNKYIYFSARMMILFGYIYTYNLLELITVLRHSSKYSNLTLFL